MCIWKSILLNSQRFLLFRVSYVKTKECPYNQPKNVFLFIYKFIYFRFVLDENVESFKHSRYAVNVEWVQTKRKLQYNQRLSNNLLQVKFCKLSKDIFNTFIFLLQVRETQVGISELILGAEDSLRHFLLSKDWRGLKSLALMNTLQFQP